MAKRDSGAFGRVVLLLICLLQLQQVSGIFNTDLKQRIADLTKLNQQHLATINQNKNLLVQKEKQILALKTENNKLRSQTQSERLDFDKKIKAKDVVITDSKNTVVSQKSDISKKNAALVKCQAERTKLADENNVLKGKVVKYENDNKVIIALREQIQKTKDDSMKKEENYKKERAVMEEKYHHLMEKYKIKQEGHNIHIKHKDEISACKTDNAVLASQREQNDKIIDKLNIEIDRLKFYEGVYTMHWIFHTILALIILTAACNWWSLSSRIKSTRRKPQIASVEKKAIEDDKEREIVGERIQGDGIETTKSGFDDTKKQSASSVSGVCISDITGKESILEEKIEDALKAERKATE
ncbi:uncharacterized protein LOC141904775 isoform X2 [Tubulanus polymorphus]|uniref:uncharacterized protein LOC141904775 isoform X2 n=1 Tax=Tubulanus polymorphus TaxID=672921 RepID=UPI003DA63F05